MKQEEAVRLAVDIGGTFTDAVVALGERLTSAKVSTTPEAPERGFIEGSLAALEKAGIAPGAVTAIVHGTTLATNALIERKGARTALITTEGFRDSLEIGYEARFDQYDLELEKPAPLIPRDLRLTVPERVSADGEVLRPLEDTAVEALVPTLRDAGVEAVAIGFLHAYADGAHERRAREILQAALPGLSVTLSAEVCCEIREYERLSTAAANAYVQPLMARYLAALNHALEAEGFDCPVFLVTSAGGMTDLETAIRFPIRLVESGPSGGAILAKLTAERCGERTVLSYDMGGTTAKICLIEDFRPLTARNFEVARTARFAKGSGLPLRIPVIEMIEIGAGGGSIGRLDALSRIAVGPDTARGRPPGRPATDGAATPPR
jgi:N-methylhydantoinase A